MIKGIFKVIVLISILCIIFIGCVNEEPEEFTEEVVISPVPTSLPTISPTIIQPSMEPTPIPTPPDYKLLGVNEAGQIPIIMFHSFVEDFSQTTDEEYTATFSYFEELLDDLYNRGFRLIGMRDFIDNNIDVPAGTMPMVFTFDDATSGQFNLIEKNGGLTLNSQSAVSILQKFNKNNSDFGIKGIFYINGSNGDKIFKGDGTIPERLNFLTNMGFEIGNHTWSHVHLNQVTDGKTIQEQLGRNQQVVNEWMGGYQLFSLALPFGGKPPQEFEADLLNGRYEDVEYINHTVMAVGAEPSLPVIHKDFNPSYVRRIRSQGEKQVNCDLTWWLDKMTKGRMYVSDGNPDTVVVPEKNKQLVNETVINDKELIIYGY